MGSLKEVRNRIASVNNTKTITKAMKVVSAAKLRKAQSRIIQMRPYAQKLNHMLQNLSTSVEGSAAEVLFEHREVNKVLMIVVSSDRGLAGSFNSQIIKEAVKYIDLHFKGIKNNGSLDIIPVGKKVKDYFTKNNYQLLNADNALFSNLTYENSNIIADFAIEGFLDKKYDKIVIAYNEFKNAVTYIPTVEVFLPISLTEAEKELGKDAQQNITDYIFEPTKSEILKALITQSLRVKMFRTFLESNTAEHGARMTAMDKATENAEDLLKQLKLQYNRERQASITKEILEIVAGAAALNG
jgi:F-type H+-transporting ATPase subunit gamma